jgi:CHAT domain-containing protein
VLSACQTGLGQVHVGEGVFGLRRVCVLAGVRTLVMSLRKVPDDQTRELMEDFYGRLLTGEGRAEALRQAQFAMKTKHPESFYWGPSSAREILHAWADLSCEQSERPSSPDGHYSQLFN